MTRFFRTLGAILIGLQLAWFATSILLGWRFTGAVGARYGVLVVGVGAYLVILLALLGRRARPRFLLWSGGVMALAVTARFYLPMFLYQDALAGVMRSKGTTDPEAAELTAALREVSTAQEQYRLRNATYAGTAAQLLAWPIRSVRTAELTLTADGNRGWSGQLTSGNSRCQIWVRDSVLRFHEGQPEGSPTCGADESSLPNQMVTFVPEQSGLKEIGFTREDITGEWNQHRGDPQRSGTSVSNAAAYRWTTRVGGELRAPVAIAGNQVFVGAHGNGEVVALKLSTGEIGWRARAPNWIHHEPVVSKELLVFGLGNNEPRQDPAGLIAFDRLTGVERWRQYDSGTMTTPVLKDSTVVSVTLAGEAAGRRIRDGRQLWRVKLDGGAYMGNPVLLDTLVLVGTESANECALTSTGRVLYCEQLAANSWGAGHASVAVSDSVALQMFLTSSVQGRLSNWTGSILGLDLRKIHSQIAALDVRTGRVLWVRDFGRNTVPFYGHGAGTPTIIRRTAYVPMPHVGQVVAIDIDSGRLLWTAAVHPARGAVLAVGKDVLTATRDSGFVVLDGGTGAVRCRAHLPGESDRAGLTVAGATGILTLLNGLVLARSVEDWKHCRVA